MTSEPYDVELPLTLPLELDCAEYNLHTYNICSTNWVTFLIPKIPSFSELHPKTDEGKLLRIADRMSSPFSTPESAMSVS